MYKLHLYETNLSFKETSKWAVIAKIMENYLIVL